MSDLLSRLSAEGPSRELDAEIALEFGWKQASLHGNADGPHYWLSPTGQICPQPPRYTEDLTAVIRDLMTEGMFWDVGHYSGIGFGAEVWASECYTGVSAANPAIALVIAIRKARNSKP